MASTAAQARQLVWRVVGEGGTAFVAGWRIHSSTLNAAVRRGWLTEEADLLVVTDAGHAAVGAARLDGETPR